MVKPTHTFTKAEYYRTSEMIVGYVYSSNLNQQLGFSIYNDDIEGDGTVSSILVSWTNNDMAMEGEIDNETTISIEFNSDNSIDITFNNAHLEGDKGDIFDISGKITLSLMKSTDEDEGNDGDEKFTIDGKTYKFTKTEYYRTSEMIVGYVYSSNLNQQLVFYIFDDDIKSDGTVSAILASWFNNGVALEGETYNDTTVSIKFNSDNSITLTFNNTYLEGDRGDNFDIDGKVTLSLMGS